MRRAYLLLGLLCLASLSAHAQDKVELFGGVSYMRFDHASNFGGWEFAGQYKVRSWLGGVADFSGEYGSPSIHTFLFGPQVSFPGRISPFGHVLVGVAHFAGGAADTSLSAAVGAGLDWRIARQVSWRVIQGDYLATRFFGATQHNARISTGIVFRF